MTAARMMQQIVQQEQQRNAVIQREAARNSAKSAEKTAIEAARISSDITEKANAAVKIAAEAAAHIAGVAAAEKVNIRAAADIARKAAENILHLARVARQSAETVSKAAAKSAEFKEIARTAVEVAVSACARVEAARGADNVSANLVTHNAANALSAAESAARELIEATNASEIAVRAVKATRDATIIELDKIRKTNKEIYVEKRLFDKAMAIAYQAIIPTGIFVTGAIVEYKTKIVEKMISCFSANEVVNKGLLATREIAEKAEKGTTLLDGVVTSMSAAKLVYDFTKDRGGNATAAAILGGAAGVAATVAVYSLPPVRVGVTTMKAAYNLTKELGASSNTAAFVAPVAAAAVFGMACAFPVIAAAAKVGATGYSTWTLAHMAGDYLYPADDIAKTAAERNIEGAFDWLDMPQTQNETVIPLAVSNTASKNLAATAASNNQPHLVGNTSAVAHSSQAIVTQQTAEPSAALINRQQQILQADIKEPAVDNKKNRYQNNKAKWIALSARTTQAQLLRNKKILQILDSANNQNRLFSQTRVARQKTAYTGTYSSQRAVNRPR